MPKQNNIDIMSSDIKLAMMDIKSMSNNCDMTTSNLALVNHAEQINLADDPSKAAGPASVPARLLEEFYFAVAPAIL